MKTRRIFLQPNECVEVVNQYGTSILKAVARFNRAESVVVIYEQPGSTILTAEDAKETQLTLNPVAIEVPITEQNSLV